MEAATATETAIRVAAAAVQARLAHPIAIAIEIVVAIAIGITTTIVTAPPIVIPVVATRYLKSISERDPLRGNGPFSQRWERSGKASAREWDKGKTWDDGSGKHDHGDDYKPPEPSNTVVIRNLPDSAQEDDVSKK